MIDPEKEKEGFISLRELVSLIATRAGKTEQRAAAMLTASLAIHPYWINLPWYEWGTTYGCYELDDSNPRSGEAIKRLAKWAETGRSELSFEDLGNEIPF